MTLSELINDIIEQYENPCGIIQNDMHCFACWLDGCPFLSIGAAMALRGHEITGNIEDRSVRAKICNRGWYDLMCYEMAICALCDGSINSYNFYAGVAGLPYAPYRFIPKITQDNYYKLKDLL